MAFANVIKSLRRNADMTQEELAEALGITSQAISRWETGAATPDVPTILKLAYLFGVTTDHLLEADTGRAEAEIEACFTECDTLIRDGKTADAVNLYRDTLEKYPKNLKVMQKLGDALCSLAYTTANERRKKQLYTEAFAHYEYVLPRTADSAAKIHLVNTLFYNYRQAGENDKAKEMVDLLTNSPDERQNLLIELADGEEKLRMMQERAHYYFTKLNWAVYSIAAEDCFTPQENAALLETMESAADALFPDDAPNLRSSEFLHCAWQLSVNYAIAGDAEKALHWLGRTADMAAAEEAYTTETEVKLNSPVFRGFALTKKPHGWGAAWVLDIMNDWYFDSIREDSRFAEIRAKLESAKNA
ncbi:MAG: helix-turn-helix domain-containing protein [Clostridia bacterium]|nr:helix-turn-helix domain-containing protein [Clostridia bacterium]